MRSEGESSRSSRRSGTQIHDFFIGTPSMRKRKHDQVGSEDLRACLSEDKSRVQVPTQHSLPNVASRTTHTTILVAPIGQENSQLSQEKTTKTTSQESLQSRHSHEALQPLPTNVPTAPPRYEASWSDLEKSRAPTKVVPVTTSTQEHGSQHVLGMPLPKKQRVPESPKALKHIESSPFGTATSIASRGSTKADRCALCNDGSAFQAKEAKLRCPTCWRQWHSRCATAIPESQEDKHRKKYNLSSSPGDWDWNCWVCVRKGRRVRLQRSLLTTTSTSASSETTPQPTEGTVGLADTNAAVQPKEYRRSFERSADEQERTRLVTGVEAAHGPGICQDLTITSFGKSKDQSQTHNIASCPAPSTAAGRQYIVSTTVSSGNMGIAPSTAASKQTHDADTTHTLPVRRHSSPRPASNEHPRAVVDHKQTKGEQRPDGQTSPLSSSTAQPNLNHKAATFPTKPKASTLDIHAIEPAKVLSPIQQATEVADLASTPTRCSKALTAIATTLSPSGGTLAYSKISKRTPPLEIEAVIPSALHITAMSSADDIEMQDAPAVQPAPSGAKVCGTSQNGFLAPATDALRSKEVIDDSITKPSIIMRTPTKPLSPTMRTTSGFKRPASAMESSGDVKKSIEKAVQILARQQSPQGMTMPPRTTPSSAARPSTQMQPRQTPQSSPAQSTAWEQLMSDLSDEDNGSDNESGIAQARSSTPVRRKGQPPGPSSKVNAAPKTSHGTEFAGLSASTSSNFIAWPPQTASVIVQQVSTSQPENPTKLKSASPPTTNASSRSIGAPTLQSGRPVKRVSFQHGPFLPDDDEDSFTSKPPTPPSAPDSISRSSEPITNSATTQKPTMAHSRVGAMFARALDKDERYRASLPQRVVKLGATIQPQYCSGCQLPFFPTKNDSRGLCSKCSADNNVATDVDMQDASGDDAASASVAITQTAAVQAVTNVRPNASSKPTPRRDQRSPTARTPSPTMTAKPFPGPHVLRPQAPASPPSEEDLQLPLTFDDAAPPEGDADDMDVDGAHSASVEHTGVSVGIQVDMAALRVAGQVAVTAPSFPQCVNSALVQRCLDAAQPPERRLLPMEFDRTAKIAEIKARKTRKQNFGQPAHVSRLGTAPPVLTIQLAPVDDSTIRVTNKSVYIDHPLDNIVHGVEDNTQDFDTIEGLFGAPNDLSLIIHDRELAWKETSSRRAKVIYKTGKAT